MKPALKQAEMALSLSATIADSPQYQRFMGAIENPNTRAFYEDGFRKYVIFTNAQTTDDLLKGDNIAIEDKIIEWVTAQKKSGIQTTTISSRMEVLKLFFEMNRKPLSWKMISKMVGKPRKLKHRGWRKEEIAKMLSAAKIREQAVILFLSSTGCRRGAIEWKDNDGEMHYLQMKHIKPRDQWHIFEFIIYEGEPEEYHTYCTPECRNKLEEYFEYRKRHGEVITPESYVFIQEWNTRNPEALKNPTPARVRTMEDAIDRLARAAGVRERKAVDEDAEDPHSVSGKTRHEQKLMHGFRAYFETTLLDAGFNETWLDALEGHRLKGLRENYYKPKDDTILVGSSSMDGKLRMLGYSQLMSELIINDEERAKYEVKALRQKLEGEQKMREEINKLRDDFAKLAKGEF